MMTAAKTIDAAAAEMAVRLNVAPEGAAIDRTDYSGTTAAVSTAPPSSGQPPRPAGLGPSVPFTVVPASAQIRPADRTGPQNEGELNALLAERARQDAAANAEALSPRLPLAAQTGNALAILDATRTGQTAAPAMPPAEAEARGRLQAAHDRRAGAREAVALQEAALAKARAVEGEAVAEEGRHSLVELEGGDELARRITEWTTKGGDRPELAPDAASLEARHARDRARVHADAARQAVAAIETVLVAKRSALAQAEVAVQAAARAVVEAVAEDIAVEGRKAAVIARRAELTALALQRMPQGYRLGEATAELARDFTGHRRNEVPNALAAAHNTLAQFSAALEADAGALIG